MRNAFVTMLDLQERMNRKVHHEWSSQNYAWYRAIWTECAELMEHQGFKWWKRHQPDSAQVQLEIIDIWHFGISALLVEHGTPQATAEVMCRALENWRRQGMDVLSATEALAADTLATRSFSIALFWELLHAAGMNFDSLYTHYVGKNVLNLFRQEHGYKEGRYKKIWAGREDNEHLAELIEKLDCSVPDYSEQLYAELVARYTSEKN